jgi:hypothetical protein
MRLLLIFFIISVYASGQNVRESESTELLKSIKLQYWHGVIFPQNYIALSYCIQKNNEISLGAYYRNTKYEYLINWEEKDAIATYFGFNFGYIRNNKLNKRFCFISSINCSISLVNTYFPAFDKKTIEPVLLGVLYWGPKLKYRLSKKISIDFIYNIGIGYGTSSTIENLSEPPVGEGLIYEILPSFEINYIFN